MDDVENEADAEEVYEYESEKPIDIKSRLKNLALSAARQAYCYSSVLVFPVFSLIYDLIPTDIPYPELSDEEINERMHGHLLMVSVSGLIVGAVLLQLIGRKLTVVAVNLSDFVILLYSYLSGIQESSPYLLTMAHHFITDVGFITFFIYLSEITSPTFRAFFMGSYSVADVFLGIDLSEAIEEQQLNPLFRNSAIAAAISLLLSVFTLETPFWLTLKGNVEKAEETFTWLRAGHPDMTEFNQMLARVESIEERSYLSHVLTSTLAVGLVFSSFMIMGTFDPCTLIQAVLHDIYSAKYESLTYEKHVEIQTILVQPKISEYAHLVYGQLIFLLSNFVISRKVLYFLSYISSVLVVMPIALGLGSVGLFKFLSSCCNLTPLIGITSLNQILPVEIYPIALREIGVAFTAGLAHLQKYVDLHFLIKARETFTPLANKLMNLSTIYISFVVSLIAVPFLLIFMPETKDTNVYQWDELKVQLPPSFRSREKSSPEEDESSWAEDESTAEAEAYE